jgi:hypothetical protein
MQDLGLVLISINVINLLLLVYLVENYILP